MKYSTFVYILYVIVFICTQKPINAQTWTRVLSDRTIKSIVTLKDSTVLAAASNGLFISTNDGKQWSEVNHNFGADLIRIKRTSDTNFAILTWGNQGVWVSSNGQTWSAYNNGLTERFILDMDFKDNIPFMVGTTGGLYLNSNGTFSKVTSILNGSWTQSTLVINDSTYIAGGVDTGVFRTTNRGQTWTQIQGLPISAGQSIGRSPNGDIYLGCWGEIESLKNAGDFTPVTTLNAFPNPFNPTTTFQYSLSKSGHVRVLLYDLTGREVAVLADGFKQSGLYQLPLNASTLSSGIYLARLVVNGKLVSSIKITLLK